MPWERDERDGILIVERPNGRKRVMTMNHSESVTKASDVNQAEIKLMLSRYEAGILPELQAADLQYRDITTFDDYADAMRHAEQAKAQFMQLDPRVRDAFDNDHFKWLDAAKDGPDPNQIRALAKLGLIEFVEPETPDIPVPPEE